MSAVPHFKVQPVAAWRRWFVLSVLGLSAVIVLGRAFELQVLQRDFLTNEGTKRHVRTVTLEAHRGAIRDRRGEPLALSAPVDSIWAVPSALLASPRLLAAVEQVLNLKPRSLEAHLKKRADKQFVYLSRQMSPEEAQRVLSIGAPGVFAQREYRRYYPAGEVAAQVVGFSGIDGHGLEGMEVAREDSLSGVAGSRRVIRDAKGRIVEDTEDAQLAQPGQDLRLTIDLRLQYLAYRELKAAVIKNKAESGLIVVADVHTGEILAMASQPGLNPNNDRDRGSPGIRNRAVTDSFEPGSTIKPLLIAHALDTGAFRPSDVIDTGNGSFKVGTHTVMDVHAYGAMDLGLILTKSSNVGAAKIGLQMGPQEVWNGYSKFALGEPVRSGFPGEALPVLHPYGEWGQIATATASYGYGLSVNALQMVRAYCALANDGLMPQLHLAMDEQTRPPQRAVSAQTARTVRGMLEGVVSPEGTARLAAISGYRIAGKTGTVRKIAKKGGGYAERRYQSTFVGMAPAANPRLVALVIIDEPEAGAYYGGAVAAPVFQSVVQGGLRLLQIPPDEAAPGALPTQTVALNARPPS